MPFAFRAALSDLIHVELEVYWRTWNSFSISFVRSCAYENVDGFFSFQIYQG